MYLTTPITANMLSKTALHTKIPPTEGTINADLFDKMRERESK
jgi:multisubunit Na+/H+ antiporter MnhG subunit